MKTKNKKTIKKPVRIFDTLYKSLSEAGFIIETGKLSDGSGSWIEIYKTKELKNNNLYNICFSFNDAGTILEDVQCFVEEFKLTSSGSKKIC